MTSTQTRPLVGTVIGDPAGIGPEVIAKAWCSGEVHKSSRPVLIGSVEVMQKVVQDAGLKAQVRAIKSVDEISDSAEMIEILDSGALSLSDFTVGQDNASCGRASAVWLDEADRLARDGVLAATVMGPISSVSMKMAGVLDKVIKVTPGESYLFLVSGPLRVAHVTDHMPLRDVCALLSAELISSALHTLDDRLRAWGIAEPRIGVAGLNPHATGDEEVNAIAPGVQQAVANGVNAEGPVSPDAIFRQCIEGRYDAILAMYHDQGHIAIKTWGFSGNSAVIIGPPYVHLSVAHGTAYDIVGKGVADHRMILSAMTTAGSLAAGAGFPKEN
tara:strand:- start:2535 stop:3524 length:990 start_codon:yes stop_codon:yes gene_type:complete